MREKLEEYVAPDLDLVQAGPFRAIAIGGNINDYDTEDYNWGN